MNISENIKYIGVDDLDLDLFESQYIVPNGTVNLHVGDKLLLISEN